MENDLVVIKIRGDDRKRLKVLAAEWGATIPEAVNIVINEWEEGEPARTAKKQSAVSYVIEKNKEDLEELLEDESPKWVCSECGRNYKEDKSEPYCEHARFTGNAYYVGSYLIRGATRDEIIEYRNKKWKEQYGR